MMKGKGKRLLKNPFLKNLFLKNPFHSYWFLGVTLALLGLAAITVYISDQVHRVSNSSTSLPTDASSSYSWSQILGMKSNAVVKIKTFTSGMGVPGTDSNGTGWITKNGYIVTCYHVLSDKHYIINVYPYLNGRNQSDKVWFRAKVVKADQNSDLAILKIVSQPASSLPSLSMTYMPQQAGTPHLILGFAGGTSLHSLVASTGIPHFLSSNSQGILAYSINGVAPMQTAGLSGAPVLNHAGKVVGIVDIRHVHNRTEVDMIPVRYLKGWQVN